MQTPDFLTSKCTVIALSLLACSGVSAQSTQGILHADIQRKPSKISDGANLPNGWRTTPVGKEIATLNDLILNMVVSPDGRVVVAVHSGFLPHGLDVIDTKTQTVTQNILLPSTWQGMTWSADGHTLFVAGGNASGRKNRKDPVAPIYEFSYADGKLSDQPTGKLIETIEPKKVWWSGVAAQDSKHLLYASNRGTGTDAGDVVVFDTKSGEIVTRIFVGVTPYQVTLTKDGKLLFVSNWSDHSVSVIDTETNKVVQTIDVGLNPNDMKMSADGRLFVACSNDNTVYVIDTKKLTVLEKLSITLTPKAPEGSTPNALAVDSVNKLVYVANADNNSLTVIRIGDRAHSAVVGFIPTGWYPSALALIDHGRTIYIGNSKGDEGHPDPNGPHSPLVPADKEDTIKTLQKSSVEVVSVANVRAELPKWTKQVTENTPYNDSLLSEARKPMSASVIPQKVGEGSPIKHIIYIIKENRTYDQEFGDLPHANGDPRLTIFGEKVTPNQHALAKQYVTFDNLYCDGEVSFDGHSWSNSAYATDFNEKQWPPSYGGYSASSSDVRAIVPSAGHLWDLAARKGLTYRSYGEDAARASTASGDARLMDARPGAEGLKGHVAVDFPNGIQVERDTEKMKVFLRDLKGFDENFDSNDPNKKMPNYIVMSLPEDHTFGTRPGKYTPVAMVANNDFAIGELVDAVSHSKYWSTTAIFIIEDDGQDGSDHVDARRTVGLVVSPYVKRGITDSTLYSTSSMVRSMELLLGLPPMSQYDAAAMPMYAAFGTKPVESTFTVIPPMVDVNAKNTKASPGAKESAKMNFKELDRAPMHALDRIIWESVKGTNVAMPTPVHRFRPLIDAGDKPKDDDD